jgi:hypothetical protein
LIVIALAFTVLNSLKPLQVDDTAYYYFARHIAENPLDPYGFAIFWYEQPLPANQVLAPPVLPYWWAAGIRLFGDHPWVWKLWLLPLNLLLVFSLDGLTHRFARGLELPLVSMIVLSPALLPSLNLMLDVPALAFSVFALLLFFRACDQRAIHLAILAGVVAGVAMETKYTAFLTPVAMLLYGGIQQILARSSGWHSFRNCLALAFWAIFTALAVFIVWECFVAWRHGESHFLLEYRGTKRKLVDQLGFVLILPALVGGVAPFTALLGLAALGRRGWIIMSAGVAILLGYGLVMLGSVRIDLLVTDSILTIPESWKVLTLDSEQVIYSVFGLFVFGTLAVISWRLLRVGRGGLWRPTRWGRHRADWFLVLWFALEVAGFLALTPFGAIRRILGVVVVGTLLAGRLASRSCRSPQRRVLVWRVVLANIALGVAVFAVDFRDAWAQKSAAEDAAAFIRARDPRAVIWFAGHWGFQFYAERTQGPNGGMIPVVPQRWKPAVPEWPSSLLRQGDWLVLPSARFEQQTFQMDPNDLDEVVELSISDWLPLRTVRSFYGTSTGVPLKHHSGPRISTRIYQVRRDFVPQPS